MLHPEIQYLNLLNLVLKLGDYREDRTGVGTYSLFGESLEWDLSSGLVPLLTTKRVAWKTALKELFWMLSGSTNIRPLLEQNVHIWTDWALEKYRNEIDHTVSKEAFEEAILFDPGFAEIWGDLGPVYGRQWRGWSGGRGMEHDQINYVIEEIKNNPYSRRLLFHAWNVDEINEMALPPCHMVYQFHCTSDGKLNMCLYQRSCDLFLGGPFNIIAASALLMMFAKTVGREPGKFHWKLGDVHLYSNHESQARELLEREPRTPPVLRLRCRRERIEDYTIDDFTLSGYAPHPAIGADVAV